MPSRAGETRTSPIAQPAPKPHSTRLRTALRWVLLVVTLALLSLLIPPVFRVALKQLIVLEAWRHGVTVQIGKVEGSLYEPVVLLRSQWSSHSRAGSLMRIDVARAEAEFSWQELLPSRAAHWFRRLTLEGVVGKIQIPIVTTAGQPLPNSEAPSSPWYPMPTRVEASSVDLLFQCDADIVRLQQSKVMITELEPGFIEIGQLSVKQPWLTRTFRNVRGTTGLQEGRLLVADLQLDPGVVVKNFAADLREIARGHLDMGIQVDAFGGSMRTQAQTIAYEHGTELEASGSFSQIGMAPLATFLGVSDAAGGTIKEGKFNFRGSPRDPMKASVTLRLEATNFQWESRQWDSLVLGATLLDGHAQIPELELRQGQNRLSLNGDMALPNGPRPWWQSDFTFNIAARIENLTELSALLLPDFRYAAGQMSINGTVRGQGAEHFGTLIVSGSNLTWRSAPIQELRAAILFTGKELQVTTLDLENKEDYLHGQGVVNLDDLSIYHGELRAAVEDLATYSALLEKPLVPQPLAGGAVVRWVGESTDKGQSGHFFAHLRHLRPLTASASPLHPVDAELEGNYAPAHLQFSRFQVADETCAFHAEVEIAGRSLHLQDLKLTHGAETWLEGDALLPLDIWHSWPDGEFPALADEVPAKVQLKATGLSLEEAARLSGWNWPVAGTLDGEVQAEGVLGHLEGTGKATLQNGRLGPLSGMRGQLTLAGQTVTGAELGMEDATGSYSGEGSLDLTTAHDPTLRAHFVSEKALLPVWHGLPFEVKLADASYAPGAARALLKLDLQVEGPVSTATLRGQIDWQAWDFGGAPEISALWKDAPAAPFPAPVVFPAALANWKLDLAAGDAAAPPEGVPPAALQGHLGGTGAEPVWTGELQFRGLPAQAGALEVRVDASLLFREAAPRDPTLDLRASGVIDGLPVNAYAVGPVSRHIGFLDSEAARAAILRGKLEPGNDAPAWATFSTGPGAEKKP